MAEVEFNADGVAELLQVTDEINGDRIPIESIIFTGPTAGGWTFRVNGTLSLNSLTFSILTSAGDLATQLFFRRNVRKIYLTGRPTNGRMIVMRESKR